MNHANLFRTDILSGFTRTDTNYLSSKDPALIKAYLSGIYDLMIKNFIETNLRITSVSNSQEALLKFFINMQDGGIFIDNKGKTFSSKQDFEDLIAQWENQQNEAFKVTHLYLAAGNEKDRKKLSTVVNHFLEKNFAQYVYIEHIDTDQLHYHAAIGMDMSPENLMRLREDFFCLCKDNHLAMV